MTALPYFNDEHDDNTLAGKVFFMKAELLSDSLPLFALGEGPHWDARRGHLYWVDIVGQAVHRYDPVARTHQSISTPSKVGFAVLDEEGQLIAGLQDGLYIIDFASGAVSPLAKPANMPGHNRFNDGKCDRHGRLWCGTMNLNPDNGDPTGHLYVFEKGGLREVEKEIYISNGLGWSPDNKTMYYTDTIRKVIWQYDYEIGSGQVSNRRVFVENPAPAVPMAYASIARGACSPRCGRAGALKFITSMAASPDASKCRCRKSPAALSAGGI